MIESILKKEYENLISKPNEVLSVFSDFYGEEFVDLQGIPALSDFIKVGSEKNIIKYYKKNISSLLNSEMKGVLERASGIDNPNYDYSFENPYIREAFYKPFILHTIKRIFDDISILIYFPEVTITNENDNSVVIKKFFAKIRIDVKGLIKGAPLFNRAEYDAAQYATKYMHSHIQSIDYDGLSNFKNSCLGSGPIVGTIGRLTLDYDPLVWTLFCLELKLYIETESLSGGPHKRMANISNPRESISNYKQYNDYSRLTPRIKISYYSTLQRFFTYILENNKIPFTFTNGAYQIALNFVEFNVYMSNLFIEWFNDVYSVPNLEDSQSITNAIYALNADGVLRKGRIQGNTIQIVTGGLMYNTDTVENAARQICCTFKGVPFHVEVTPVVDQNNINQNLLTLLNPVIVEDFVIKILPLINTKYGTSNSTSSSETSNRLQGSSKTFLTNH